MTAAPTAATAGPASEPPVPSGPARPDTPASIRAEIAVVLLVTLGTSGLFSLVTIIETQIKTARAKVPLSSVAVSVAAPLSDLGWIDLTRQLLLIVQHACWGLLALYLLWRAGVNLSERIGLNLHRPGRDLAVGIGLAAFIGIPGLGLYLLANARGLNLTVQGSTLTDTWWRLPVSIGVAVQNGFLEEVLVIGYLLTRLGHLRVRAGWAVAFAAVLRGSYHLYQGYGGFLGNALMGVIFGLVFLRWRRVWPLVVAHSLIDIVVFVGYPLLHGHVSWLP